MEPSLLGFCFFDSGGVCLAACAEIPSLVVLWIQDEIQGAVDGDGKLERCMMYEPVGAECMLNIGFC